MFLVIDTGFHERTHTGHGPRVALLRPCSFFFDILLLWLFVLLTFPSSRFVPFLPKINTKMTLATVSQSFRASPDGPIVKINALWDPKANHHIVLWSRIQFAFKNLQSVQLDDTIVSFMVDDAFEE